MKVRKAKNAKNVNEIIKLSKDHAVMHIVLRAILSKLNQKLRTTNTHEISLPADPFEDNELNNDLEFVWGALKKIPQKVNELKESDNETTN